MSSSSARPSRASFGAILSCLGLGACVLSGPAQAAGSAAETAASAIAAFPVIAYFPNWVGNPTNVEFDKLTHVNYSFVLTNNNGSLNGPNDGLLRNLVTAAHAKNVKVGVAVGGWNDGNTGPFEAMAANPTSRAAFVKNVIDMCDKYSLDGIDMDWEYPKASSVVSYTAMMKELSAALKAKNRFLSAAVVSSGNGTGQYITNEVFGYLDFLNIMAYDAGGANHTSYAVATTALDYWVTQRKCPKEKAILGLGFYGRDANGGSYTDYRVIMQRDPLAYTKDQSGNLGYNGVPTIERKVDLAAERGGGVMIWEISQDTHDDQTSLLRAINRKVKNMPVALRQGAHLMAPLAAAWSPRSGLLRIAGAPQGALTLRLRSVEGKVVFENLLRADAAGKAVLKWDGPLLGAGAYVASVEGNGRASMSALLPAIRP